MTIGVSAAVPSAAATPTTNPKLLVAVVTLGFTLSYVDRNLLSLLVTPIKASLGLSDTQIGLLQGLSFSIFYVVASLPLAWAADRVSRPRLIAVCVAAWSLMTAACGLASSFAQLMLARVGVAVGEAGLPPAAQTLMADTLDRRGLARATSIFMLAPFIGGGLVLIVGGPLFAGLSRLPMPSLPGLGVLEPWQAMFIVVGLPGLLLALFMALALREPNIAREIAPTSAWPLVALYGREWRLFALYALGIASIIVLMNAHIAWMPTALMRRHGVGLGEMGLTFGMIYLAAGTSGTLVAGAVIARSGEGRMMLGTLRMMRGCALLLIVPAIVSPLMPTYGGSLALLGITVFLISAMVGLGAIPMQIAAPHALRAQVIATTTLVASLLGGGLGPVVVGFLSDRLLAGQAHPLSAALALVAAFAIPTGALLIWTVIHHLETTDRTIDRASAFPVMNGAQPRAT